MKKLFLFGTALLIAAVAMAQTPTVSASSVTFKYCQTTYGTPSMEVHTFPFSWMGLTFLEPGTQAQTLVNARGCDSIVMVSAVSPTNGDLPGLHAFSVSATKQVYFSQGNLQYKPDPTYTHTVVDGTKPGVWRFAEHQWDFIGYEVSLTESYGNVSEGGEKCENNKLAGAADKCEYTGWYDLFGQATSGWNYSPCGASLPWNMSTQTYNPNNLNANDNKHDWGFYNAISNGGNVVRRWHALLKDEWEYMFNTRTAAIFKKGGGSVNGVRGMILLPDDWDVANLPDGITFTYGDNINDYTLDQWSWMEALGAVFLPCGGYVSESYGNYTYNKNTGNYWCVGAQASSSSNSSCEVYFSSTAKTPSLANNRQNNFYLAVRLVRDAQ